MILAATGHRPDKLGGYPVTEKEFNILADVAAEAIEEINPDAVITGMALGWDMAVAEACCFLKLPYIAAVPFVGQESRWNSVDKRRYRSYLERARQVEVVCEGNYAPWKMHHRNKWMVDRADRMLALYDGQTGGGTSSCVEYAVVRERPITNVWERWKSWPR